MPQTVLVPQPSWLSPDPLSPTLSNISALKTPENIEEESDDPEPAYEGDIPMEYASNWLCSSIMGAVTKDHL
jgi:hypothetical protein